MNNFNSINCESSQRASNKCKLGGTISLFGVHSKQWSTLWVYNGVIKMITYPNRIQAKKEYEKLAIKVS